MIPALANNAVSELASGIGTGDTTISLKSGDGSKFPTPGAGEFFPIYLVKSGGFEIAHCTSRSSDQLTVSRGQEGTSALSFSSGDVVSLRATAKVFGSYLPLDGGTMAGDLVLAGDPDAALKAATKQYVDAKTAVVMTEVDDQSTVSIFGGSDADTWKDIASIQVTTESNQPVVIEALIDTIVDQLSTDQVQAGPGGPEIQFRLLRDGVEIWSSSSNAMSVAGVGQMPFQSRRDTGASAGAHTYRLQAKWSATTYSAGSVDVSRSGGAYARFSGNGVYWPSYVNADWEIQVPSISNDWAQLTEVGRYETANTQAINRAYSSYNGEIPSSWPDDISLTGVSYTMRNPQQALIMSIAGYWVRALEYRS